MTRMGNEKAEVTPGPASRLPMVALVGRVNVGKSTLFNRLVRQRRSLVENRPGVTRDRVAAEAGIEGREVLMVDTGGLDPEAEEGIPRAVRRQVEHIVEEAALVLFVVDARAGLLPLDQDIADVLRRAEVPVVVVANKADGPQQDSATSDFFALGFTEVLPTSAEHRRGLADLEITIERLLPPPEPRDEDGDDATRVAIVGRPNVGKSSLLNRLVGEDHAIVSAEPGTTRDSTDIRLAVDESEVVLIDTAGLRRAGRRSDRLERGSAFMALRSIERADVVLLLIDVIEGVTDQDARIARLALDRGRPLVLVCNKWDAVDRDERRPEIVLQLERKLGFVPDALICHLSARTGKGTRKLLPRALQLLEELRGSRPTSEVNRVLRAAVNGHAPPAAGRRRARFFYATQVSDRPFTVMVFVNDPSLVTKNYRRYLESFFRKSFGLRSAPVRLLLRTRSGADDAEEIVPGAPSRDR
jgi:GTP-binding protein